MPPKAKGLAKAKAKVRAKAKAKGAARAKAMVRARGPGRGVPALRRPAGALGRERGAGASKQLWDAGEAVPGEELALDWLKGEKGVVIEECKYFHRDCRVAGKILGSLMSGSQVMLRVCPTGTTDEGILKLQSGQPSLELRAMLCPKDCSHEETAEDLVHVVKIRKMGPCEAELAWVNNLEKVAPVEGGDELEVLRAKLEKEKARDKEKERPRSEGQDKKEKKEKDKEKKERRKKKKKKSRKRTSTSEESRSGTVALNGSRARQASQKRPRALFSGTGLDPLDKVRSKVLRLAKRYVKKKGKKTSSSSASSSAATTGGHLEEETDTIFQQAARVRGIAEAYPGVLASQALVQMRSNLLQSLGEGDTANTVPPVAVQYYRQVLQKKASGPVSRELLTLCALADMLVRGKAAQALDLALQRVKSAESTLGGTHWSVSQKLEILPAEQTSLTDTAEMKEAQRIALEESKLRWTSSLPDGRSQPMQKGGGKPKGSGKDDFRRGGDGKKGGKGQGKKGEWKKPEESAAKGS